MKKHSLNNETLTSLDSSGNPTDNLDDNREGQQIVANSRKQLLNLKKLLTKIELAVFKIH